MSNWMMVCCGATRDMYDGIEKGKNETSAAKMKSLFIPGDIGRFQVSGEKYCQRNLVDYLWRLSG